MFRISRVVVVVCLVLGAVSLYAAPADREGGAAGVVRKVVKKIKALGDLITVPIPAPKR